MDFWALNVVSVWKVGMICGSVAVATNSEVRISRIGTLVCTTTNQPSFPMGHLLRQVDLHKEGALRLTVSTFVG